MVPSVSQRGQCTGIRNRRIALDLQYTTTEVVQLHITGDQFSQHTDRQLHQLPRFIRGFDDSVERPILAYNFILIWPN